MAFYQIHRREFFFQERKNLDIFAKNVKFLIYLEFKCLLGNSCVGKECEVQCERFKQKRRRSVCIP